MTTSEQQSSANNIWTIFVDGASSSLGSGDVIILEKYEGLIMEVSLIISFPTSNNQAKYKAFLAELHLAKDIGAREAKIYIDSQLIVSPVNGDYQEKMTPSSSTWPL